MNNPFKFTYILSFFLLFTLWSCGSEQPSEEGQLEKLDTLLNELTDQETGRIKPDGARNYIAMIEQFVADHPTSVESPKQLYKAAEVARSVQDYQKALNIYARIESDFPQYEKASKALFMQAFTYAEDLKNDEKASELYNAFIAKYPEDDFVDDAQILLETMGKTDEEIFEALGTPK